MYGIIIGMLCELCIKFKLTPANGNQTWTHQPCITIAAESIQNHARSKTHKEAEQMEAQRILSSTGQGIESAVLRHKFMEKTALVGAFRTLYWLAAEELPHTTKYSSLLGYAKLMGCSYLNLLHKGENVNYESQRTIQDMLEILSSQISGPIVEDIQRSQYYSLLIDETTDVAVMKQMVILARYLTPESEVCLNYSQNLTHSNLI